MNRSTVTPKVTPMTVVLPSLGAGCGHVDRKLKSPFVVVGLAGR